MVRLKSLNVKVNIGSIRHGRSKMVVLCCECLFVCLDTFHPSLNNAAIRAVPSALTQLPSRFHWNEQHYKSSVETLRKQMLLSEVIYGILFTVTHMQLQTCSADRKSVV